MSDSKLAENRLLTIAEAAKFLGVSRATFNNIRRENDIPEVIIGKRPRFHRDELLAALSRQRSSASRQQKLIKANIPLDVFSNDTVEKIEVRKNVFDLKRLVQVDPYGALSLLCKLLVLAKTEKRIDLLIDDGHICQYLKTIHFFYHLERQTNIFWNKETLKGTTIQDTSILIPISAIRVKGGERIIAEDLLELLRQQGFKDPVGQAMAIILGELADNSMTHSQKVLSDRVCYISAKRFILEEANCITIGVADPGLGIPSSLKQNPVYSHLSDEKALLESFRPNVTSWQNSPRGKGLTDVLSMALGNRAVLRVDTGAIGLSMDLRDANNPKLVFQHPQATISGTRFGLILIDTHFEKTDRKSVDTLITKKAEQL